MDESYPEKVLRLKRNKLRVNRIYRHYTTMLDSNPNILSQLWFADSYEHVRRIYDSNRESAWCSVDYSHEIFLDDAEYRLDKWERHQADNN